MHMFIRLASLGGGPHVKSIAGSNYEVDPENEEPYWETSSREDELKMQIKKLGVLEITLESLK